MSMIRKKFCFLLTFICICLIWEQQVYAADTEWFYNKIQEASEEGTVYTVAQDGSGDFQTIQEGVNAADSGDTLVICPGNYVEAVQIEEKQVNLIGIDRDYCIIEYDTVSYGNVPLTLAAGNVCNLTIRGIGDSSDRPVRQVIPEQDKLAAELGYDSWKENYSGYAVHIDQDYSYGRNLTFEHCRIESYNSYCVGIGSRGENKISFIDCELNAAGEGGCIYLHDSDLPELGGNSYLIIKNSVLQSSLCPYLMTIHALHTENHMYLTFQEVRVYAVAYEDDGGYLSFNMNTGIGVEPYLIHSLTPEQAADYMDKSPYDRPAMEEGITYIRTGQSTSVISKRRHVISVYNIDGIPGNGWCGLNNTWLTSDSYGNTLSDMNYIKMP